MRPVLDRLPSACRRTVAAAWFVVAAIPALAADDRSGLDFFESKIRPVLVDRCYACHSGASKSPKGKLRLDSRDGLRKGGVSGPPIEPGKPDESLLIQAIEQAEDVSKMPPQGEKLPAPVVADFRRWVEMGAPDPRDAPAAVVARARDQAPWWSLRPIVRPPVLAIDPSGSAWVRTPIDAFILAKLRAKSLSPSPEADRRTLIRRLSFDLTGLPPTPEETAAFVGDPAPQAYERLVDRLLASPAYGERWARHWMDLVHFAESHGHDQDRVRPNAWPYRDYLIAAFNRDTPYARFVEEQLAGDVLFPNEPHRIPALGFIASGPWDESSLRDIREDSIDRQIGHYLDRDDMVSTAMSTFVSSTVHCARCHDHKFDPITQDDYYSLQAVFAGVDKAERAYDADPEVYRRRAALKDQLRALKGRDKLAMEALLAPALQSEVTAWEAELRQSTTAWTILTPQSLASASGASFIEQPDHSILSGGDRPATDTYTITVRTDLRTITAIRLELLPDDRLPSRGPGRNENGNLHLTEFRLKAAPAGDSGEPKSIPIRAATADFDQTSWGIGAAIDANPQTAWGIYPETGKPHEGIFVLATPVGHDGGTRLTVELQQTFPVNHLIGRFRLSATDSPQPGKGRPFPGPIGAILGVAPDQRTREQRQELSAYYLAERLERELAALPKQRLVYAGARDFAPDGSHRPPPGPRPVHVLRRGDINKPGAEAAPGTLSCLDGLPARFELPGASPEGLRRAALARWITDRRNPLTWRSIVNRAWHYHFGRGIVDTPNDFGRMGALPTHAELLDWLAAEFLESGGSLKQLHRLIVTSAAYRQAWRHDPKAAEADADDRLLWRRNRARLDAESIRDAILKITGRLDRTMGGPSVQQFAMSPGVHVTPVVDYTKYDWNAPSAGRRAVYRFLFRTLPDPFIDGLDGADASQLTAVRNVSVTPLQALALLNDSFILNQSESFARRLDAAAADLNAKLRLAYELALLRDPTDEELREASAFAQSHGLAGFCRLLLNTNEFLFVD